MINFSTHDLVDELVKREGVDHCVVQPHHPYEVAVIEDLEALERKDYQAAYAQDKRRTVHHHCGE